MNSNKDNFDSSDKPDFRILFIIPASMQMPRRKCVYIQEDYVELISRLVAANRSPKITIGGYINAVLEQHFEAYKDEIEKSYNDNISKPLSL